MSLLVKDAEISYIQLLYKTSLEIEKLKLVIQELLPTEENKESPLNLNKQIENLKAEMIDIDNPKFKIAPSSEILTTFSKPNGCDKLTLITDAKISLIQLSAFKMDGLRTMIKYLTYKGKINLNASSSSYDWNEITEHCVENDLWIVHQDKVYDITKLLKHHPGGRDVIIEFATKNQDITIALKKLNHPIIYRDILKQHYIGTVLNKNNNKQKAKESFLCVKPLWDRDEMDISYASFISNIQTNPEVEPIIKWDDFFSVHVDILDKQYQHLMVLINNLYFNYEFEDIIELLHRWDVHCKTEETLFFYYNFDQKPQQQHNVDSQKIYRQIKDQVTAIKIKYNRPNTTMQCKELISFAKSAAQIFKRHHDEHDSKYKNKLYKAMDIDPELSGYSGYECLTHSDLIQIVSDHNINYLIIDVRDVDYIGGHVSGSNNISHKIFCGQLAAFVEDNNKIPFIVIYCMYGAHRSIKCARFYSKAINQIIKNYSKEHKLSFYFRDRDDIIDEKQKIEIKCNDECISNLSKQKIFILKNGFFQYVNAVLDKVDQHQKEHLKEITDLVQDFDGFRWEQLSLAGVYNKKMWYHKREYFQKTNT